MNRYLTETATISIKCLQQPWLYIHCKPFSAIWEITAVQNVISGTIICITKLLTFLWKNICILSQWCCPVLSCWCYNHVWKICCTFTVSVYISIWLPNSVILLRPSKASDVSFQCRSVYKAFSTCRWWITLRSAQQARVTDPSPPPHCIRSCYPESMDSEPTFPIHSPSHTHTQVQ